MPTRKSTTKTKRNTIKTVLSQKQMREIEPSFEDVLSSITEDQVAALLYVVQDMINGQTHVLCSANDMSDDQLREARGEIRGLYEFAAVLSRTWRDAVYGDSDEMKD